MNPLINKNDDLKHMNYYCFTGEKIRCWMEMAVNISGIRRNIKNVAHNYTDAQVRNWL